MKRSCNPFYIHGNLRGFMAEAPSQLAQSRAYQLDGLRAVAVLMVFLFHEGLIRSGWIGVDIFFAISDSSSSR